VPSTTTNVSYLESSVSIDSFIEEKSSHRATPEPIINEVYAFKPRHDFYYWSLVPSTPLSSTTGSSCLLDEEGSSSTFSSHGVGMSTASTSALVAADATAAAIPDLGLGSLMFAVRYDYRTQALVVDVCEAANLQVQINDSISDLQQQQLVTSPPLYVSNSNVRLFVFRFSLLSKCCIMD